MVVPSPSPEPVSVQCAGAGVVRKLVRREVEDARVVVEDILRPIAVVDIEVDDRDALDPRLLKRPCATATATLLNRQKPIARSGVAWWPGGRTKQNAESSSPRRTASVAASAPPAARSAASYERALA